MMCLRGKLNDVKIGALCIAFGANNPKWKTLFLKKLNREREREAESEKKKTQNPHAKKHFKLNCSNVISGRDSCKRLDSSQF